MLLYYSGVKDIKEQLRVLNLLVLLLPDVHQAVLKVSYVCVCINKYIPYSSKLSRYKTVVISVILKGITKVFFMNI